MDFVFGEIPDKLDPFDYEAFYASPCEYYAGATDVETGKPAFFGKEAVKPGLSVLRASCSMPMLSKMVEIEGRQYLDGGVAAPIPLDFALQQGCEKLVVVLTQPRGFKKKAQSMRPLYHAAYRHTPGLVRAMDLRHMVYNHSLEKLWRLEAAGTAVVALPPAPLQVGRFGQDADELKATYAQGLAAGKETLERL